MNTTDRYEALVRQYSEPLYWHIRRMVVCHEDAEDILQETLTKAYLHLWQLRDKTKVKAWLYRVATNSANCFLRKKSKELKYDDLSDHLTDMIEAGGNVDFTKAAAIDLQKAVLKLPKTQQLVFNLKFHDGMEYDEISRITGSSIETLRVNYHFAKKKVIQYIYEEQL